MTIHATFIDNDTSTANRVDAAWLNDVNIAVYTALGTGGVAPTTATIVVNNLAAAISAKTFTSLTATNIYTTSDITLKTDVCPFVRGLKDILAINPITYKFKADSTGTTFAGFSAQDVAESVPEALGVTDTGALTLADRPIVAALVNAVKTLHKEITMLRTKVERS